MERRFLVLVGCIAALLLAALPAAANNVPTTGARLVLGPAGPTAFAANSPFYIEHGFACELGDAPCMWDQIGRGRAYLYVDGVLQRSKVDVDQVGGVISKLWLVNFPSGLPAGPHVFRREWFQGGTQTYLTATKTVYFS